MERIYLASQSPRRAQLLAQMDIPFVVVPSDADESIAGEPEDMVRALAVRKARGAKVNSGWVLAADTLVFLDGKPLGKPKSAQDAENMLRALSGRTHQVLTGLCLRNAETEALLTRVDGAAVVFDEMTESEIKSYVASGEPLDKAGAYGIQGRGGAYIQAIRGDYYAVVGLSLRGVRALLKEAAIMED